MKRILGFALLAGALGLSAAASAERVAFVDVKKVFDAYNGTKTAKDELKKKIDQEKSELETEKDALDKEASDLESQKSVLSDSAYRSKAEALQVKGRALQDKFQSVTDELQQEEAAQTAQIVQLIKEATSRVARREKYDLVLTTDSLLFGGDDVTAEVIQEINQ